VLALLALGTVVALASRTRAGEPVETGAAATWHWIQKLSTTASLMHTTAHPDDEHGGMLAVASRGLGARVSLLTLNRGEAGDNAIGPQLFDALGLIRTEELAVSNRYYGVDRQYFSSVIDYGFSKRLEEAFDKWGREHVLRDVVRIIRTERPLVVVSRFQGNARDGHGNHQTAGLLTQHAVEAAADPAMFPDQVAAGLRPWTVKKLYLGGARADEPWTVMVETGAYSPWLGDSFANVAREGLGFQRSQNGGRVARSAGPVPLYYTRVGPGAAPGLKEPDLFAGIDTSIPGLFEALGRPAPSGAVVLLRAIDEAVTAARDRFDARDPSRVAAVLARGLAAARRALERLTDDPDATLVLERKVEQFQQAIAASLGLEVSAMAQPAGSAEPTGPAAAFAPPPVMANPVPGQTIDVRIVVDDRGHTLADRKQVSLDLPRGWSIVSETLRLPDLSGGPVAGTPPVVRHDFTVRVSPDAALSTRPYFSRPSLQQSRYDIAEDSEFGRPFSAPPLHAIVRYRVDGVPVEMRVPVRRRESKVPYGFVERELRVVPALAVRVTPGVAVVPLAAAAKQVTLEVDVLNNRDTGSRGDLRLDLPAGWTSEPARLPFTFARAGERAAFRFTVRMPSLDARAYEVRAIATSEGREYSEGYEELDFRDLETRHLYRPAATSIRGIDVATVPNLRVGYVMGIGDQVPEGIRQLGYEVTMLDEAALAGADLSGYDAIMTGTRAYAVRADLRTYNQRLLDYARNGGHLIVLYNTQELVPDQFAPYPGELTARAEEVSEEDSPVEILAPDAPMLRAPNRITAADFDGWIEQRGSKFWSAWDAAYTPIVATHDIGQAPQRGGWLWARVGRGHYTYFAYAFHRQLPYGVPGVYRLLANLLALGRAP
jgi:LmbE family N-acetylglucosaminyl deacetylase